MFTTKRGDYPVLKKYRGFLSTNDGKTIEISRSSERSTGY